MDRKSFLKTSSLVGLGFSAMPFYSKQTQPERPIANPRVKKKVIVAGAGIAGLCCAYELMKKGHDVVVLEAAGRYGGTVLSVHDGLADGLYADYGAENFTKPGYENYWKYIEEFNIPVIPYYHGEIVLLSVCKKTPYFQEKSKIFLSFFCMTASPLTLTG